MIDLEKAREAVRILETFAFASGKITTGQVQDILWGARLLAYGLLFLLIWLIWWMGVTDAVTLQIAGNCSGQGMHILTVVGANVTGNCLNWTITT